MEGTLAPRPTTDAAAPGTRPPIWRRRWIVDGPFQWHLISRALLQTLLTLLFVSIGIFGPIVARLSTTDSSNSDDPAIVMLYMHGRFWWIAAACLLCAAIGALLVSHRIAGPLVRFKRNLRWLSEGHLPAPLRTRARDHLKVEVDCLNAAVAGLGRRVEALRTAQGELRANLRQCVAHFDDGNEPDARAALQAATAALERLATELEAFQHAEDQDARRSAPMPTAVAIAVAPTAP